MPDDPLITTWIHKPPRLICVFCKGPQAERLLYAARLRHTVESLDLPGVEDLITTAHGLCISFDPELVTAPDLEEMVKAAEAATRSAPGTRQGERHSLRAVFGGCAGPDLGLVAVMCETDETSLVRRLTRVAHRVWALIPPAASPLLHATACRPLQPSTHLHRAGRPVPAGALILSDSGIAITLRSSYSSGLRIGALSATPPAGRIRVRDEVRLKPVGNNRTR